MVQLYARIPRGFIQISGASERKHDRRKTSSIQAAGQFTGAIVVIRRGTCGFAEKTNNAAAAGAIAVVIANNAAGGIIPTVTGATIPAFGTTQANGNAIATFVSANQTTATAQVSFPAVGLPAAAEQFSSEAARSRVITVPRNKSASFRLDSPASPSAL